MKLHSLLALNARMKLHSLLALSMSILTASAFAGSPGKAPAVVQPPVVEEPLGFTATIGYDTHYIFRGVLFAENLVSAAIDGTIPLTDTLSLNAGAWYATSADDSGRFGDGGSYHELDLYAGILVDLGPATVGLKYTHYFFGGHSTDNGAVNDVNEIGLTLATTVGPVDVTAGVYYDDETDGFYGEVGVSHIFAITDSFSLVPGALISYGEDYYDVSGFNHVKVGVSAPIKLTSTATLTPYIAYNIPIDALDDLGEDDQLYGGISLSVSF
jgi:hypothetical protein